MCTAQARGHGAWCDRLPSVTVAWCDRFTWRACRCKVVYSGVHTRCHHHRVVRERAVAVTLTSRPRACVWNHNLPTLSALGIFVVTGVGADDFFVYARQFPLESAWRPHSSLALQCDRAMQAATRLATLQVGVQRRIAQVPCRSLGILGYCRTARSSLTRGVFGMQADLHPGPRGGCGLHNYNDNLGRSVGGRRGAHHAFGSVLRESCVLLLCTNVPHSRAAT